MARANFLASVPVTFLYVGKTVVGSLFFPPGGRGTRGAVTATAVFMVCFLVVHALGNVSIVKGREAFNLYGYMVVANPAIKFIEIYLLVMFLCHLLSTMYLGWTTPAKRAAFNGSPTQWKWRSKDVVMATTGTVLLAFICVHLNDFRFGPKYPATLENMTENPFTGGPVEARDLYRIAIEVLDSDFHALFYAVSVLCVGFHLSYGWEKAARKLGIPQPHVDNAIVVGNLMNYGVCGCFLTAILVAYLRLA